MSAERPAFERFCFTKQRLRHDRLQRQNLCAVILELYQLLFPCVHPPPRTLEYVRSWSRQPAHDH